MIQVLRDVKVWGRTEGEQRADLWFEGGKILGLDLDLRAERVWTGGGALVVPGFIDMQARFGEPGYEVREDLRSGLCAAAAGGFVCVVNTPETEPVLDHASLVEALIRKASALGGVELCTAAALTLGQEGSQLTDMFALAEIGVRLLSDGREMIRDAHLFRRACEYASAVGIVLQGSWCEARLARDGVMHDGAWATKLGLPGKPASAEEVAMFRDATLAADAGCAIFFPKVSTARGLEIVRSKRAEGAKLFMGVTPHHLLLDHSWMKTFSTVYKVSPPLRPEEDCQALRDALCEGTIDCVVSDHQPWTVAEKELDLLQAPYGYPSLETVWPVLYEQLVCKQRCSLEQLLALFTSGPAKILGRPQPSCSDDAPANFVLLDLDTPRLGEMQERASKALQHPWSTQACRGWPMATFMAGRCVFERDQYFSLGTESAVAHASIRSK
ncbi:MAG: dihydroorotase [Myxococcota bacterium]